jgi:hypothetical protein
MFFSRTTIRRRVWVGLLAACAGVGAWILWTRGRPAVPATALPVRRPFVQLAGAGMTANDQLLREKAELMDPTPLFFPTAWNYGHQPLRESELRQPGQVFASFPPQYVIEEKKIGSYGAEEPVLPEKLADVLVQGNEAPFAGIGQVDRQRSTLPVRSGYLEISDLGGRDFVVGKPLSGLSLPRTDFAPVEFLVVVGAAGLIGDPLLTSGSGWEEVDNFFRAYLVKSYRLGERLPPGRYRVVVGA